MKQAHREYREAAREGGAAAQAAGERFGERMTELGERLREETNQVSEQHLQAFRRELQNQITVTKNISRLSPVSSYVYVVTELAATGVSQQLRFMDSLRDYQYQFRSYVDEKMGDMRTGRRRMFMRGRDRDFDISDMPQFEFTSDQLSMRFNRSLVDLCLLAVAAVFLFMLAYVKFLRADVIE